MAAGNLNSHAGWTHLCWFPGAAERVPKAGWLSIAEMHSHCSGVRVRLGAGLLPSIPPRACSMPLSRLQAVTVISGHIPANSPCHTAFSLVHLRACLSSCIGSPVTRPCDLMLTDHMLGHVLPACEDPSRESPRPALHNESRSCWGGNGVLTARVPPKRHEHGSHCTPPGTVTA